MIETLKAIKLAARRLMSLDFEFLRERYNACALADWEAARDAARKRNASVKRKNKKLPRGQKLKPEKMPKRPRKLTAFGNTGAVYIAVVDSATYAVDYAANGMAGRCLDHAAAVLCSARRVRRIADKAAPLKDCEFLSVPGEIWTLADLIESLTDKAKEFIKRGGT